MQREIIHTSSAPAAVGPYSQAVRAGNLVFTAGQIGLNPATGQLVDGGVEAQTRQIMANLSAVLEAAGTNLNQVVKTTIFLTDMAYFGAVNAIYAAAFTTSPPARSTVAVVGLPKDALVEIEVVALVNER